jgi:hypothetical protein
MVRHGSSVLFALAALSGCDDSPSGPSEELALSQTRETASYVFHYSRNDFVEAERQQAFHDWTVRELGVLFLRESRGLDRLKSLFSQGNTNDSEATLRESFERVYGVSLEQIEGEWIALLDGG